MGSRGYDLGGELDECARETDRDAFMKAVAKHAKTRNVSDRVVMLWCRMRAPDAESEERMRTWIQEEDATGKWLEDLDMSVYELSESAEAE